GSTTLPAASYRRRCARMVNSWLMPILVMVFAFRGTTSTAPERDTRPTTASLPQPALEDAGPDRGELMGAGCCDGPDVSTAQHRASMSAAVCYGCGRPLGCNVPVGAFAEDQ